MKAATGCHSVMPQGPGKEIALSCDASVSRAFLSSLLPPCPSMLPGCQRLRVNSSPSVISPPHLLGSQITKPPPTPVWESHLLTSLPQGWQDGQVLTIVFSSLFCYKNVHFLSSPVDHKFLECRDSAMSVSYSWLPRVLNTWCTQYMFMKTIHNKCLWNTFLSLFHYFPVP